MLVVSPQQLPRLSMKFMEDGVALQFANHSTNIEPDLLTVTPNELDLPHGGQHIRSTESVSPIDDMDTPALTILVLEALEATGYPLRHINCDNIDGCLTLTGSVSRYFYLQIAIETAKRICRSQRIDIRIDVAYGKTSHTPSGGMLANRESA